MDKRLSDNLTKRRLNNYTYYDVVALLTVYIDICNILDIDADNVYKIKDVDNISKEDLYYMAHFLIAYEHINNIYQNDKECVNAWFRRKIDNYPFNNHSPLEYITRSKIHIMRLRIYTSALLANFKECI